MPHAPRRFGWNQPIWAGTSSDAWHLMRPKGGAGDMAHATPKLSHETWHKNHCNISSKLEIRTWTGFWFFIEEYLLFFCLERIMFQFNKKSWLWWCKLFVTGKMLSSSGWKQPTNHQLELQKTLPAKSLDFGLFPRWQAPSEMLHLENSTWIPANSPNHEFFKRFLGSETWPHFRYHFLENFRWGQNPQRTWVLKKSKIGSFLESPPPGQITSRPKNPAGWSTQINRCLVRELPKTLGGSSQLVYKKLLPPQFLSHFRPCIWFR